MGSGHDRDEDVYDNDGGASFRDYMILLLQISQTLASRSARTDSRSYRR